MPSSCNSGGILATAVNQVHWRPCNQVTQSSHNRVCYLAPVTFTAEHQWQKKLPGTAGGLAMTPTVQIATHLLYVVCWSYTVTGIRPRVWDGMQWLARGYWVILPFCHKCRPFYRCTSFLPRSVLLFLPPLFARNWDNYHSMVVAAHRRLLFDRSLDSRQWRAVTTYTKWADMGVGFHSQIKYRQIPIHPNTGQYRPIPGTPVLVSFKP